MTSDELRCLTQLDEAAVLELAGRLVRLRTVNDPASGVVETPVAEVVAGVMRDFGWQVAVTDVAPGRPNVVGVIHGRAPGRTLMFEGHSDVVTEGDPAGWSFDPYAGDVVDGRLRGRGSADMKAGVAAMIHAARAVELAGFNGRIVVGVLVDEEGLMLGVKHFAASDAAVGIHGVIVASRRAGRSAPSARARSGCPRCSPVEWRTGRCRRWATIRSLRWRN